MNFLHHKIGIIALLSLTLVGCGSGSNPEPVVDPEPVVINDPAPIVDNEIIDNEPFVPPTPGVIQEVGIASCDENINEMQKCFEMAEIPEDVATSMLVDGSALLNSLKEYATDEELAELCQESTDTIDWDDCANGLEKAFGEAGLDADGNPTVDIDQELEDIEGDVLELEDELEFEDVENEDL